ncbi:MAG: hypothetical protein HY077_16970, partial [Elusimicrobia bacterium]|nr:hypothetical protein [Elusimicrobiota bacterium]
IRVFVDRGNTGTFSVVADTQVSPANTIIHNFPEVTLAVPVYSSNTSPMNIFVNGLANLYPPDNVFVGDGDNRLVFNDEQTDELQKEVVHCYGVNISSGQLTGCVRGSEGTTQFDWSTGTIISGPARVPILGAFGAGGQIIDISNVDYYVAFDVAPLAKVSPAAKLGLVIPNTTYLLVSSPKQVSPVNIGVPQVNGGQTVFLIDNVAEYPDAVKVVSTNTLDGAIGPFFQQNTTVAVAVMNLNTNVADALLRWMLVYATGTATAGGQVSPDVDLVSLWYDAPGNGVFSTSQDVLVGTGTFGNFGGIPLKAQINMSAPIKVVTPALAAQPQRFFVAYHIAPNANPVDLVTGAPRTLGGEIHTDSFPQFAPVNDDPLQNSISLPNFYDTSSPLPFSGRTRPIIAAPQQVYIQATPSFTTSSGTFPAPALDVPVNGLAAGTTDCWVLTSTAGLPSPVAGATTYLDVGSEIVSYAGFGTNCTLLPAPIFGLEVTRGQLNTGAVAHAAGSVVGPDITQGELNLAVLRLDVWSQSFQVQWSQLLLSRFLPPGLNGDDDDISTVRVWQSGTANRAFNRDPITGQDAADLLVGSARFGQPPDPAGLATININDPNLNNPGYLLVAPSTKTFYISFDVSVAAKFSYPTLSPPSEVAGAIAASTSKFVLTPLQAGHTPNFLTPLQSPTYVVSPTVNTITATLDQLSGNTARQNQKNVPMMRMKLVTDRNTAIVQKIRLDHLVANGGLDSDITLVKVWADLNGNGAFDIVDSSPAADGSLPGLLSFGNEAFSSGTVNMILKSPITVSTTPAFFFVTYDISQFAGVGFKEGIAVSSANFFTVQLPNTTVFPGGTGFASNPLVTIQKVTSNITLGVNDIAVDLHSVDQAQQNVPFMRFNLATDIALSPWRNLRIERGGGSQDPLKPLGRNTDVKFVRLFKDINQNDVLDASDVNISEVFTSLVVAVSSSQTTPFDLVVGSTQGFPTDFSGLMIGGRLYLNNGELMTFSGPGCAGAPIPGTDPVTGKPCLAIISRGDVLGQTATPLLILPAGAPVIKVDVFDQTNDANVQTLITLNADQLIGPTASAYFAAYDIGDAATRNDLVNTTIRAPSWIGLPAGDNATQNLRVGISRTAPLGTSTTNYPFVGTNVAIAPINLSVSGFTIAPSGASQGQVNVPLMEMTFNTSRDFINIGALKIRQFGTIVSSTATPRPGDGDFTRLSVWLDNGSEVFTPNTETLLGFVTLGSSFTVGVATIPLNQNGLPYLHVSTSPVLIYVAADIGFTDAVGTTTLGHQAGAQLASFFEIFGPGGLPVAASPDPTLQPPIISKLVTIAPLTVPSIAISSSLPPIIVVREQVGVSSAAVGFPAYGKIDPVACNNGKDPLNLRNDICRDVNGNPIPDQTKWMCLASSSWTATCGDPLIDVNGDGIPDNFIFGAEKKPRHVSLIGDGIPARDITGTGILDLDYNNDGIVDMAFPNGFGGFQILLGNDATDQGNSLKATPVPDQGFVPSSWSGKTGSLIFSLPMVSTAGVYQVTVGKFYDDQTSYLGHWSSVTFTGVAGLRANGFGVLAATAPVTSATVSNLTLGSPNVARLTLPLTPTTTAFMVDDASKLVLPGLLYVGSEVLRASIQQGNVLLINAQKGDPPPGNGRGLHGSAPIAHLIGEPVSDGGAILFARFVTAGGITSPARPMLMFRADPTPPATPGPVQPLEFGKRSYPLRWTPSAAGGAGVMAYEVQERGGAATDLAANVLWRTLNIIPAPKVGQQGSYTVGDGNGFPGELARPSGQFFTYRVRAISGAGVMSNWSPLSTNVNTGITSDIVAGVSNYPNPFDTRKGGGEGQTVITYILGANSDVEITLYDLLGYVVKKMIFQPGDNGGRVGPNFVVWDGHNGSGSKVAKGGYIARIKVRSPLGTATAMRKIGVLH